jgi:hypothetical protein
MARHVVTACADEIQQLRANAAFASIAMFMLTVGLALVDTAASNINTGLAQGSQVTRSVEVAEATGAAPARDPKVRDGKDPSSSTVASPGVGDGASNSAAPANVVQLQAPEPIRLQVDGLGPIKLDAPASIGLQPTGPIKLEPTGTLQTTNVVKLEPTTAKVTLSVEPPSPIQIQGLTGATGPAGNSAQPWTPPAKGFTRICDKQFLMWSWGNCRYVPAT